jgi:hypothetical protein
MRITVIGPLRTSASMARYCEGLVIRRTRPVELRRVRVRVPANRPRLLRRTEGISLLLAAKPPAEEEREQMPTFGSTNTVGGNLIGSARQSGWLIVAVFLVIAVLIVAGIYFFWSAPVRNVDGCPVELHRQGNGRLVLMPSGQTFADMNEFQQWWHSSPDARRCPIPLLTGVLETEVLQANGALGTMSGGEQLWATTPIYKADDYEFSRVFGVEKGGRMIVPRQNFNLILEQRAFDWADKPLSSDERKGKYMGLVEMFSTTGDIVKRATDDVKDARARFGSPEEREEDPDIECKLSREAREVAKLVERAYASDPDYEPVVTKVGANHWEVAELKPRRRTAEPKPVEFDERVVNTANQAVDVKFKYREDTIVNESLFPSAWSGVPGQRVELPWPPTKDRVDWSYPVS